LHFMAFLLTAIYVGSKPFVPREKAFPVDGQL